MKRIIQLVLIAAPFFFGHTVTGQATIKIGHINSQELYTSMPEMDSAQKKLEAVAKRYEETLEQLQVEFNKKYDEYGKLTQDPTAVELILRTKADELSNLQQRIEAFQQEAQNEITRKRNEFFQPIQEKAQKAINDVGTENSFTYIFDINAGIVFAADNTIDVLPLVKKKLGIE